MADDDGKRDKIIITAGHRGPDFRDEFIMRPHITMVLSH